MPKIIKATDEQQREWRKTQVDLGGINPPRLYGYVTISGHRCAIAYLGEGQGEPNYELFAPDGYTFEMAGPHSELHSTLAELQKSINWFNRGPLVECDADCDCGKGKQGAA